MALHSSTMQNTPIRSQEPILQGRFKAGRCTMGFLLSTLDSRTCVQAMLNFNILTSLHHSNKARPRSCPLSRLQACQSTRFLQLHSRSRLPNSITRNSKTWHRDNTLCRIRSPRIQTTIEGHHHSLRPCISSSKYQRQTVK